MSRLFVFDTETSGMPDWKNPSDGPQQPHLVEVGALVVDADTYQIIHSLSVIVRPDGWMIDEEVAGIHGITHERAMDVGIPEAAALAIAMELWRGCDRRVGYNQSFDARIFRIALKRFMPDEAEAFKAAPAECCMLHAQKVVGGKFPKLADAYRHFIGAELEDAHSAYGDAMATARLHKALRAHPIPA